MITILYCLVFFVLGYLLSSKVNYANKADMIKTIKDYSVLVGLRLSKGDMSLNEYFSQFPLNYASVRETCDGILNAEYYSLLDDEDLSFLEDLRKFRSSI